MLKYNFVDLTDESRIMKKVSKIRVFIRLS
jgi:hypothetical protein